MTSRIQCLFCGTEVVPDEPVESDTVEMSDEVRLALSEMFRDYGDQALAQGDRFAHSIWMNAAGMARDFVHRRRVPF